MKAADADGGARVRGDAKLSSDFATDLTISSPEARDLLPMVPSALQPNYTPRGKKLFPRDFVSFLLNQIVIPYYIIHGRQTPSPPHGAADHGERCREGNEKREGNSP